MATTIESVRTIDHASRAQVGLRTSEKLILGFLAYGVAASVMFPLAGPERLAVGIVNALAAVMVLFLSRDLKATVERARLRSEDLRLPRLVRTIGALRDWLPCLVILLAYRESSLLCPRGASGVLNGLFERWDASLVGNGLLMSALVAVSPWLGRYLEFAYLLCYPMVPLGFAVLFFSSGRSDAEPAVRSLPAHLDSPLGTLPSTSLTVRRCSLSLSEVEGEAGLPRQSGRAFDRFWTGVLLALFTCYTLYPLFPLTTPRLLAHDFYHPESQFVLRRLNLWLLGQYASSGGVFPSGHVAGVTAVALSIWRRSPAAAGWGVVFTIAAASIAAATVIERYHYLADALAGALIAAMAVSISNFLHRRRPQYPTNPH
jgi:membrane-associated phospholipid phosphatase